MLYATNFRVKQVALLPFEVLCACLWSLKNCFTQDAFRGFTKDEPNRCPPHMQINISKSFLLIFRLLSNIQIEQNGNNTRTR